MGPALRGFADTYPFTPKRESFRIGRAWKAIVGFPAEMATPGEWRELLRALVDHPSNLPDSSVLKYSPKGEVIHARWPTRSGELEFIAKRSRAVQFRQVAAGWIRGTRGKRNHAWAIRLRHAGIHTARPLALIERMGARPESWLVTEYVPSLVDLDHIALSLLPGVLRTRQRAIRNGLIEQLADLLIRLGEAGLHHRDLKASNILFSNWEGVSGRPCCWLVDLDGLQNTRRTIRRRQDQALVRLASSLRSYSSITSSDYLRFLRVYQGRGGLSGRSVSDTFHAFAVRARAYACRSQRRKGGKLDGYHGA